MMSLDSIFTVAEECRQSGGRNSGFKEFWPDLDRKAFKGKF
jgi:hypothetical protein